MRRSKRIKDRLGANGPGLTVAVIALVFALVGGAFAASGGLSGKQKKEVEKIAKKSGKPGATGPAGAAGSTGSTGATGATGAKGDKGDPGKSVKVTKITSGSTSCEERNGALVKEDGASTGVEVCEGSPWVAGGTLPPEATETGTFSVQGSSKDPGDTANGLFTTISFPIPLSAGLDAAHIKISPFFPFPAECKNDAGGNGTVEAPAAQPGYLCIYSGGESAGTFIEGVEPPGALFFEELSGTGTSGARLRFEVPSEEFAYANGSFAVTAPAEG